MQMERNRKMDGKLKDDLDTKKNIQVIKISIGHINKKLDEIKSDTHEIKKSSTSKVPLIFAIVSLIFTISGVSVVGIIDRLESKAKSDVHEDKDTGQMEKESDTNLDFQKVIDLETNKDWWEKNIVGTSYEPDLDVQKWLTNAVDYTYDWDSYNPCLLYGDEEDRIENAGLVGRTENFLLYDISINNGSMLIKTSEDSYVLAEGIRSSIWNGTLQPQPSIMEVDYDNDGDNELAIYINVLRGTGETIDSLFMVDKASDGCWYMFQFLYMDYLDAVYEEYNGTIINGSSYFVWNGNVIDIPQELNDTRLFPDYCIGNIVSIDYYSEQILIRLEVGYNFDNYWDYSKGHGISAEVNYKGEGKWELSDYAYYNDILERYVTRIMGLYLMGDVETIAQEYEIDCPVLSQSVTEYDIVEILYNSGMFGEDNFQVDIEYTIDHIDITHYAILTVQKVDSSDNSGTVIDGLWKICDFTIIN